MTTNTPLVLMILDGWGYNESTQYNAIAMAKTPQWDAWWHSCPHALLHASGMDVGLPSAQMGNSEVGHMHIGSGRIIQQDFTRINNSIADGSFAANPVLNEAISTLKKQNKSLHLMGLFSSGGVHSHEEHLFAILKLCVALDFHSVILHLFLDGRDTPPKSAISSFVKLNALLKIQPVGRIASITGRYYAMDRDKRWERIEPVYNLITKGQSTHHFNDAIDAIEHYYSDHIFDEFIPPTQIGSSAPINDGDAVMFFNFRADRARQLTNAFLQASFDGFKRPQIPQLSYFISMTQFDKILPTTIAFPPIPLHNTFGEVIASHGLSQLRIAETEKYAHVTFFFNGGSEQVFPKEVRHLIPSPKVATYDLKPEMSAETLTDALVDAISQRTYDVIICNYANADMVGHSGNLSATIKAIECLDTCMKRLGDALKKVQGTLLITADHGNAELMFDENANQVQTAHTNLPVPFLCIGGNWQIKKPIGSLIDIAPTMLHILNIKPPKEMEGQILLETNNGQED